MKCIILNVETTTSWKGKPLSEVIITAAKFDRDNERGGIKRTMRHCVVNIAKDYDKAYTKFMSGDDDITNEQHIDFINKFLEDRKNETIKMKDERK